MNILKRLWRQWLWVEEVQSQGFLCGVYTKRKTAIEWALRDSKSPAYKDMVISVTQRPTEFFRNGLAIKKDMRPYLFMNDTVGPVYTWLEPECWEGVRNGALEDRAFKEQLQKFIKFKSPIGETAKSHAPKKSSSTNTVSANTKTIEIHGGAK
jgi:hypothetical protein